MIPLRNQYPNRLSYNPYSARSRAAGMSDVNFGVDMQIPGMPTAPPPITIDPKNQFNMNPTPEPQPQPQQQVPGVNQPMDFAAEYAKLNSNRPNRLAYQQAVNEGEPTIQRGKWAKLAAILAGAGTGVSEGPTAGMNLGLSSYYEPQRKASEKYNKKMIGLERLAGYEDSDMANQIKALEVKERQYWNKRQEDRADRAQNTQDKMAEAQMSHLKMDTMFTLADKDGKTWLYDKSDPTKRVFLANTGESTFERLQTAAKELRQKLAIEEPYNIDADERKRLAALEVEGIRAGKGGSEAKPLTPDQQATKVWNDITKAFSSDPLLVGKDPKNYITAVLGPGGNTVFSTKPSSTPGKMWGSTEDDEATTAIKTRIREVISKSMSETMPGGGSSSPTTTASATAPAGVTKNPDGTVPMIDPEGGTFNAKPEEVDALIAKGAKVAGAAGAPTVTTPSTSTPKEEVAAPSVSTPRTASDSDEDWNKAISEFGARESTADARATQASRMGFSQVPPTQPAGPYNPNTPPPMPNIPMARQTPTNPAGRKVLPDTLARSHALTPTGATPGPAPVPPPNMPPMMRPPTSGPNIPPVNPIQLAPGAGGGNVPPPMPNIAMARTPASPPPIVPDSSIPPPVNPISLAQPPTAPIPPALAAGKVNPITLGDGQGLFKPPPVEKPIFNAGEPATKESVAHFKSLTEEVADRVKEKTGYGIKFTSKKRTAEQQKSLYEQGRGSGDKRPIITNADGTIKKSQHQADEAVDIVFVDPKGKVVKPDYNKNKKLYDTFGKIAEEAGLTWGGRWKDPFDPGHIQLRPIEVLEEKKPITGRK